VIDISEFFIFNHFETDKIKSKSLQKTFNTINVLMHGKFEKELLGIYKDGGIHHIF
jgi:hypothetical protein